MFSLCFHSSAAASVNSKFHLPPAASLVISAIFSLPFSHTRWARPEINLRRILSEFTAFPAVFSIFIIYRRPKDTRHPPTPMPARLIFRFLFIYPPFRKHPERQRLAEQQLLHCRVYRESHRCWAKTDRDSWVFLSFHRKLKNLVSITFAWPRSRTSALFSKEAASAGLHVPFWRASIHSRTF